MVGPGLAAPNGPLTEQASEPLQRTPVTQPAHLHGLTYQSTNNHKHDSAESTVIQANLLNWHHISYIVLDPCICTIQRCTTQVACICIHCRK